MSIYRVSETMVTIRYGQSLIGHDLEREVATEELRQLLHQAIAALPPLDKAVVVLSDLEELSNRDIGDVLGLSVPAVKSRLHRARLFLRGKLAVSFGYSPA